jgi:hypothetical protein
MKIWARVLLVLLVLALVPLKAAAYSYGNPNEEQVAEVYKQFYAKLSGDKPDFAGAKQVFDPIVEELDMHMGPEPAKAIKAALEAKDQGAAIVNFQKTLVLNTARRLESAEKEFANYQQAKLLLAKGLATYEALAPTVKEKDAAADAEVRAAFDKALEALGNPGLFGVGVKEPDPQMFKMSREKVLSVLQKLFAMPSLEVGHFVSAGGDEGAGNRKADAAVDGAWKNWLPLVVIVALFGLILWRTMARKRRG